MKLTINLHNCESTLPRVNIMWSKLFRVSSTKSGYQGLEWYFLVLFNSFGFNNTGQQADSWPRFDHVPVSLPHQSLFRILFWTGLGWECCSFQCLCKKGHEEWPSCKTHCMTYQKKLSMVQRFHPSLTKLLPRVSETWLNIRVHCSYSRCPAVHKMVNREKLAGIQRCTLLLFAKSSG